MKVPPYPMIPFDILMMQKGLLQNRCIPSMGQQLLFYALISGIWPYAMPLDRQICKASAQSCRLAMSYAEALTDKS